MKKNKHIKTPFAVSQAQPVNATQTTAPYILIATPCYGSQIHQTYHTSTIRLLNEVYRRKVMNVSFSVRGGDSLITRLRNSIVAEFLANPQYTHLLFIDADVGYNPDEVFTLIASGHDVACGMYPLKALPIPDDIKTNGAESISKEYIIKKHLRYPFNPVSSTFDVINGFVEVKDAPTGFMCIKREVFTRMIDAYPELKYQPDYQVGLEALASIIDDCYYNFFDDGLSDESFTSSDGSTVTMRRFLSEDYMFCRLWQKIGGKVHVFAGSKLTHTGLFTYEGDFQKHFEYNYNVAELASNAPIEEELKPDLSHIPTINSEGIFNTDDLVNKSAKTILDDFKKKNGG